MKNYKRRERRLRKEIISINQACVEHGLIRSSDGNISTRLDNELFLITPSGMYKKRLKPKHLLIVNWEGDKLNGKRDLQPTSEILMHLEAYRQRDDIRAVLHAHPPLFNRSDHRRNSLPLRNHSRSFDHTKGSPDSPLCHPWNSGSRAINPRTDQDPQCNPFEESRQPDSWGNPWGRFDRIRETGTRSQPVLSGPQPGGGNTLARCRGSEIEGKWGAGSFLKRFVSNDFREITLRQA